MQKCNKKGLFFSFLCFGISFCQCSFTPDTGQIATLLFSPPIKKIFFSGKSFACDTSGCFLPINIQDTSNLLFSGVAFISPCYNQFIIKIMDSVFSQNFGEVIKITPSDYITAFNGIKINGLIHSDIFLQKVRVSGINASIIWDSDSGRKISYYPYQLIDPILINDTSTSFFLISLAIDTNYKDTSVNIYVNYFDSSGVSLWGTPIMLGLPNVKDYLPIPLFSSLDTTLLILYISAYPNGTTELRLCAINYINGSIKNGFSDTGILIKKGDISIQNGRSRYIFNRGGGEFSVVFVDSGRIFLQKVSISGNLLGSAIEPIVNASMVSDLFVQKWGEKLFLTWTENNQYISFGVIDLDGNLLIPKKYIETSGINNSPQLIIDTNSLLINLAYIDASNFPPVLKVRLLYLNGNTIKMFSIGPITTIKNSHHLSYVFSPFIYFNSCAYSSFMAFNLFAMSNKISWAQIIKDTFMICNKILSASFIPENTLMSDSNAVFYYYLDGKISKDLLFYSAPIIQTSNNKKFTRKRIDGILKK